jgi:iron complex transport system permease protein
MNTTAAIRGYRDILIISSLGVLLFLILIFSLTVGAVSIPFSDAFVILLKQAGIFSNKNVDETYEVVMTSIRLPRILMTLIIGAALGVSGASLQGLFRNPLVEPSLIGVSGGSAAAVVVMIVFGSPLLPALPSWIYNSLTSLVAFAGGVIATFIVLRLSLSSGRTNIAALILIGVAINALTGALIGLAIFYADENQLSTFMFWTLGDLGGATWDKLQFASPLLVLSTFTLLFFGKILNVLALGESEAYHMGVNVEQIKRTMILLSALAVGISVSLAGIIGFVGLIVPHVIRTLFHPGNHLVLPASALGGAVLLLVSDIVARTIVTPAELPIGVVTALIGAPFFIMLLLKAKQKMEL